MPTFIQNQQPKRVSHRCLRAAAKETLAAEGVDLRKVELSIALVDDNEIRQLNARYRKKDQPTDVLSFAMEETVAIPGRARMLGDVVISVDTAVRQAQERGIGLNEEVCHLLIHGILHLLGYDDATPEGYAEMVGKDAAIWRRLNAGVASGDSPAGHQPHEQ